MAHGYGSISIPEITKQGDLRCSTKELMIDDEEPAGGTMQRNGVVKVALETFEKFPEGAAIGSHFNCWSMPAATNETEDGIEMTMAANVSLWHLMS